ncbi:Uncharacterised protein [Mycobacterium tuberculosis]|nr:Uncharacterised protein [Mycobacterium tuberculosis]
MRIWSSCPNWHIRLMTSAPAWPERGCCVRMR